MSDIDHGIAGAIGAVIVGAGVALKKLFGGKTEPPELPAPSPLASRVGRLYEQHETLRQEIAVMRHDFTAKIDQLVEDVGEMRINHAATAAILPRVESRLTELRDDLRRRSDKE